MELADVAPAGVAVDPEDVLLEPGDRRPLEGDLLPDRRGRSGERRAARHGGVGGPGDSLRPLPPRTEAGAVIGLQLSLVSFDFWSPRSPACMASLKFRMPLPRPRASSGIFLPPKMRSRMIKMSISSGKPIGPIGCTPRRLILDPVRARVNQPVVRTLGCVRGWREDETLVSLASRDARL